MQPLDPTQDTERRAAHRPCPLRMAGVGELTLQPQGVQQADGEIGAEEEIRVGAR